VAEMGNESGRLVRPTTNMGRKWIAVLALVGAIVGVGWMAHSLSQEETARSARRGGATQESETTDTQPVGREGTLVVRDGFAEVVAEPSVTPQTEPGVRYWYGVAIDARTRLGEAGVPITVESIDEPRTWPGGHTQHNGMFVIRVPEELEGGTRLRLTFTTHDGRLGMRAIKAPSDPSLAVGRVLLKGVEQLRGRCVTQRGDAVANAQVSLRAIGELLVDANVVAKADCDEHGYFEIKRLPRGLYVLEGRGQFGHSIFFKAPLAIPHPELLVVREAVAQGLDVVVRNSLGQLVVGATVHVRLDGLPARIEPLGPQHLLVPKSAVTGDLGRAVFGKQLFGHYLIDVVVGQDTFRFEWDHAGNLNRFCTVPVDPRVLLQFTDRNGVPAANVALRFEGGDRSMSVKTDGDGIVRLARGSPPRFTATATTLDGTRAGSVRIGHDRIVEGQVAAIVVLQPPARTAAEQEAPTPTMPRFAVVHTVAGLPVRGARLSGARAARTGEDGRAALGAMSAEAAIRLRRNDLASGHPSSGQLGAMEQANFVWRTGHPITISVTDASYGFPLDRDVRIGITQDAWKRIGPGRFQALWDIDGVFPLDARLFVTAPGYAPLELPLPTDATELHAALLPAGEAETATLVLRMAKRNRPIVGVRVRGTWRGTAKSIPGRGKFVAVSAEQGRLVLAGLKRGRWLLIADAGFDGWSRNHKVLAAGRQELTINLTHPPTHVGFVHDERGRPVARAEIQAITPNKGFARSRKDGSFALNMPYRGARGLKVEVTKAGYTPTTFEWTRKRGEPKRPAIRLERKGSLELPFKWAAGGGGPIPTDLRFRFFLGGEPVSSGFSIQNGRLIVDHVPRGDIVVVQVAGSAHVPKFTVKNRKQPVRIVPGVMVVGRVQGFGETSGVLISVRTRGTAPRTVRTDKRGRFELRGMPPGTIDIEMDGQEPRSRKRNRGLRAGSGDTLEVEVVR